MCFETITDMALGYADGCENPAGIAEQAYWIPVSYFAPSGIKVPTVSTTAASLVKITASHVLKAGKSPIPVQVLYPKSGANSSLEGEQTSKVSKTTVELFIPNITADNLGVAKVMKNQRGILLFKGADGGTKFWQVGTADMLADVENIDANFGTGPTGEKGIKVTIGAYGTSPYWSYEGELPAPAPAVEG